MLSDTSIKITCLNFSWQEKTPNTRKIGSRYYKKGYQFRNTLPVKSTLSSALKSGG